MRVAVLVVFLAASSSSLVEAGQTTRPGAQVQATDSKAEAYTQFMMAHRLEEDNETLRAQRDELHDAVQTIASQMTRAADELLYRFGTQPGAPSHLAPR